MNIKQLQQEEDRITKAIATIQAELNDIGGDAYRGCWLDSTKDRTGTKTYTRLRWFIDVATKKKGSRIVKGDEVGTATRAIALWAELATLEGELARVGEGIRMAEDELAIIESLARSLGWTPPQPETKQPKPKTRRGKRNTSTASKAANVQTIPDGTRVKVPAGWNAEVIGYEGKGRYQVRFLNGITDATDSYPRFMLEVVE